MHYALPMTSDHVTWAQLAREGGIPQAETHLGDCELCRQRLLKLLHDDRGIPDLAEPLRSDLAASLELCWRQAGEGFRLWRTLLPLSPSRRAGRLRRVSALHHLPMAQIVLQDGRQFLRSRPKEARIYAGLALDLLRDLAEPFYLLADARAEAHLLLGDVARRAGDLSGQHLAAASMYLEAGTGCPILAASYESAAASFRADVGDFSRALEHLDLAIEGFRLQGEVVSYAVVLVKRAGILSWLDPAEGAVDAASALRWMDRQDIRDPELVAAALAARIECLVEAGRPRQANRLFNQQQRMLLTEGAPPLFAARMEFLGARLLLELGLPFEGELALRSAIEALEPLHPQDAARAKLVLIRHLVRDRRQAEATKIARSAVQGIGELRLSQPTRLWRSLLLHWSRGPLALAAGPIPAPVRRRRTAASG